MYFILLIYIFNLLKDNIKKGFVKQVVRVSCENRAEYLVRSFVS